MVVEMITRQVCENRDFKWNSINALLLESVGRHFQHRFRTSDIHCLRENLVQFEGFRRRMRSRKHFLPDAILDGADQSDLATCSQQHPAEDERRRGLAVRASDASDRQLLRGMAVEVGAEPGQCQTTMRHSRPRNSFERQSGVAHHGHSSIGNCLIDVAVAVGGLATHGDETPPWLHPAAIVVQPGDGRVAALLQVFRTIKQL
jgi:hypothetical protein